MCMTQAECPQLAVHKGETVLVRLAVKLESERSSEISEDKLASETWSVSIAEGLRTTPYY